MRPAIARILLLVSAAMPCGGCGQSGENGQAANHGTIQADPSRDAEAAQSANQAGVLHLQRGDLELAAEAFGRALKADVEFGPAHNNLGKVYFLQRKWGLSANAFETASRLMPARPEPHNNLGLVLEQGDELDRAIEHYRQAVSMGPDNVEYRANLARALVRRGDRTEELRGLLQQIVAEDTRPAWRNWATAQLARMPIN